MSRQVLALDHAGIHVADLERSIAFYADVLGMRLEARFELGAEQLAFMATASGWIELIQDAGPRRSTGAIDHVALRVADLDVVLATLRASNVRLLDEAPLHVAALNARILFCLGPDDERIELIQRL